MKLNKKLLMAALAGAIVVGGGVGSFAEDAADPNLPKTPEYKGESGMYKPNPNDKLVGEKFHKDLQEAKDNAIQEAKANGITSEFLLKNIKNAKTIESVKSFAEELINSHYSGKTDKRLKGEDLQKAIEKLKAEEADKKEPGDDIPEDSPYNKQTPFAYRTKEEAEAAAKKALENELLNPGHINNGYEVVPKSDGNWDYVLKIVDKSEEQKPEEKPGKNPGITIDEWLKLQKEKEKNPGITIDEWLKLQKEKEKNPGITIDEWLKQQNKGRKVTIDQWLEENGLKDPEKTPEKPEVQNGFKTEKEAIAAAKKALKDDKINNTFSVRQGADDKYYYVLGYEHKPLVTIDEWLANNTPEEEGKISDNWYDQSKHPFEENKEQKPEEKPGETPEPGVTPTPSVPENHYHENDYANIGAGEGTKEDGKKEDSKEESKENGKKEDSKEESKENGKEEKTGKEEKPEKPDMPAKPEKLGKGGVDSPNKKKKAELPKAGSEAEILTLAAASLSSVAGAFISLKKRK